MLYGPSWWPLAFIIMRSKPDIEVDSVFSHNSSLVLVMALKVCVLANELLSVCSDLFKVIHCSDVALRAGHHQGPCWFSLWMGL